MWKGIFVVALLATVSAFVNPPASLSHRQHEGWSDQILVKFKSKASGLSPHALDCSKSKVRDVVGTFGSSVQSFWKDADCHVLKLKECRHSSDLQTLVDNVKADPNIEYAEVDRRIYPTSFPNDPLYAQQWHYGSNSGPMYGMNLPGAWNITTGSPSVVVAVIDSGVLPHPDLVGNLLPGYDMIVDIHNSADGDGRDPDASDPGDWLEGYNSTWHGTHVAGTIAAVTDNFLGVAGVAWKSKIIPVRFLGTDGGYESDLAASIRWAGGMAVPGVPINPNPAKVISISAAGEGYCTPAVQSAIAAVVSSGCIVVVAAGNEQVDASDSFPANCDGVLVVGAHDTNGTLAWYSNYGPTVDILAPGGDDDHGVLSTSNTGLQGPEEYTYLEYEGTSMATPHISGLVALMLSVNPNLQADDIEDIIKATAKPALGKNCLGNRCGAGLADAQAALAYVTNMPALSPPPVNDDCSAALQLSCGSMMTGSTRWATPGAAVANCVPNEQSVSASVWYYLNLVAPTDVRISTCNNGTNFDTMISVFSGSCSERLSCVAGQNDGPRPCGSATALTLNEQIGDRWIMVHGYSAERGDFTLSVRCSVSRSSSPSPQRSPLPTGSQSPSPISQSQSPSVSSLNQSPSPQSPSQSLSISPMSPSLRSTTQSASSRPSTASPSLSLRYPSASPVPLPSTNPLAPNDECSTAIPVTCGGSVSGNTQFATVSSNKPNCVLDFRSRSKDLWYFLDVDQPTVLHLSTCIGTDFNTMISVFSGNCKSLSCVAGENGGCGRGQTDLTTGILSGRVLIMVHGFRYAAGRFSLSVECNTAPRPALRHRGMSVPGSHHANNVCASATPARCGRKYRSRTSGTCPSNSIHPICVPNITSVADQAWFTITLPKSSTLTLSTCHAATEFNTMISLFSGVCNQLSCIASADDANGQCGATSVLSQGNLQGTYYIMVHGHGTEVGAFELSVDC